jgi:AcrR family transcriptional regulator
MVAAIRLEGRSLLHHPIAGAVIEVINERGYEQATSEEFCRRAGMSGEEFAQQFGEKVQATLRVTEAYVEDFKDEVARAFARESCWPASLRAAAYEAVRWFQRHPEASSFGMVGILGAGGLTVVRREEAFKWCAQLIDAGREVAPDPGAVPDGAALMAVGAVAEVVRRQQEGSFEGDFASAVPQLMYGAVRPYLGEEAARAELGFVPPPDLGPDRSDLREAR